MGKKAEIQNLYSVFLKIFSPIKNCESKHFYMRAANDKEAKGEALRIKEEILRLGKKDIKHPINRVEIEKIYQLREVEF